MNQTQVMFSGNGKVSVRQMYRLLILEIFGISSLILPGNLAKICQNDGFFAILAAAVLWAVLLRVILRCRYRGDQKNENNPKSENKPQNSFGVGAGKDFRSDSAVNVKSDTMPGTQNQVTLLSKIRSLIFMVIFSIAGGFLLYILSSLVENQLLDTGYLWLVVLSVLFAGGYGIVRGLECRARMYEVLFWFLIVPLLFVMILGTFEVKADYWLPVFACGWRSFGLGVLLSMAAMSPALISVLFLPFCAEQERAVTAAPRAVLTAGVLDAVLYLLLLGVFQWKFLSQLRYPAISLMAVVQMPGDLFERQDALMTAIWFFCLFALFHSLCHYGALYLQKFSSAKGKSAVKTDGGGKRQVIIVMVLVLIAGLVFLLNGCGKREPEESMYPLAIGIQAVDKVSEAEAKTVMADGGARSVSTDDRELLDVFYAWPVPGGSDSSKTDAAAGDVFEKESAATLFDAQTMVSENTDKTLDFNHLKVLVLNVNILKDEEQMQQILYYFKENENMAWNTCVIVMEEDVESLFTEEMASGSKSLGLYLEQMLRGREDLKADATVTVKDLMSLYLNQAETILIPQLSTASGQPEIDGYRIYARRTDHGVISPEEASYGYLLLNLAKTIRFSLPDGNYVTVQDLRLEREFADTGSEALMQKIRVTGTVKMSTSTSVSGAKQDEILSEATKALQEELNRLVQSVWEEHQADITGSFLVLPGYEREVWKLYRDNPDAYEKKLKTQVEVSLKMLNL